ncbi:unnamed protein product [Spodoptera exigua]|nr:unnamed protein product [Spodoptera exigua]
MDYVVGSVAALITGNVTPHRPTRLNKIALTPTKHQPSPNVTPKSEFVDDRSIFLSPSMQKKKAIVKKSPKRIFQNPDLDTTENGEGNANLSSPKADKVKKHLKDDLEAGSTTNQNVPKSPKGKGNKRESVNQEESVIDQDSNENTPKKKKKKLLSESETATQPTESQSAEVAASVTKSPKKNKQRRKSVAEPDSNKENGDTEEVIQPETTKSPKKQNNKSNNTETEEKSSEITETNSTNSPKKKNKKRKKKSKAQTVDSKENTEEKELNTPEAAIEENVNETEEKENKKSKKKNKKKKAKLIENVAANMETDEQEPNESENEDESSTTVNPNAITDKDSDSEHDSDDEIDSENEEINKKVLEQEKQESSDEEEDEKEKPQKGEKKIAEKAEESGVERSTEDEIKRTLFVGNVPFSAKCKKEVKKIFSKHGQIETIRIRTVPVKDGRYTPKLAVIKHELHPERTTVNVYIKYASEHSVEKALVENNTVLNDHHLRVSRSSSTGAEHDPKCSIFIGNLPFAMEDEALRAKFEKCGEIHSVRIIRDKKTNAGKGFGYVNFESKDGVELALALTEEDLTVKNRILRVKRCTQVTNKKKPDQTSNNQNNQPQRGFRGNQGHQRGNFRPGNQIDQRNGPPGRYNQGNRQNGPPSRNNQGNRQRNSFRGDNNQQGGFNKFGGQRHQSQREEGHDGAHRRIMNKRKSQEGTGGDGPPNKRPRDENQPNKEKKPRKEFVGMTAEKKKKRKFDKGQKKKKALSEILTK